MLLLKILAITFMAMFIQVQCGLLFKDNYTVVKGGNTVNVTKTSWNISTQTYEFVNGPNSSFFAMLKTWSIFSLNTVDSYSSRSVALKSVASGDCSVNCMSVQNIRCVSVADAGNTGCANFEVTDSTTSFMEFAVKPISTHLIGYEMKSSTVRIIRPQTSYGANVPRSQMCIEEANTKYADVTNFHFYESDLSMKIPTAFMYAKLSPLKKVSASYADGTGWNVQYQVADGKSPFTSSYLTLLPDSSPAVPQTCGQYSMDAIYTFDIMGNVVKLNDTFTTVYDNYNDLWVNVSVSGTPPVLLVNNTVSGRAINASLLYLGVTPLTPEVFTLCQFTNSSAIVGSVTDMDGRLFSTDYYESLVVSVIEVKDVDARLTFAVNGSTLSVVATNADHCVVHLPNDTNWHLFFTETYIYENKDISSLLPLPAVMRYTCGSFLGTWVVPFDLTVKSVTQVSLAPSVLNFTWASPVLSVLSDLSLNCTVSLASSLTRNMSLVKSTVLGSTLYTASINLVSYLNDLNQYAYYHCGGDLYGSVQLKNDTVLVHTPPATISWNVTYYDSSNQPILMYTPAPTVTSKSSLNVSTAILKQTGTLRVNSTNRVSFDSFASSPYVSTESVQTEVWSWGMCFCGLVFLAVVVLIGRGMENEGRDKIE